MTCLAQLAGGKWGVFWGSLGCKSGHGMHMKVGVRTVELKSSAHTVVGSRCSECASPSLETVDCSSCGDGEHLD